MTGCIYVAQGARILKVGRSKTPSKRFATLQREFQKYGDNIDQSYVSEPIGSDGGTEYVLISKVEKIRKAFVGREWFEAGDFKEIADIAIGLVAAAKLEKVAPEVIVTKEQKATARQRWDARKKLEREQRAAEKKQRSQNKAERRLRRILRSIEVACRSMWSAIELRNNTQRA